MSYTNANLLLVAAGTTLATALKTYTNDWYNEVLTCTASANGIALPLNPIASQEYTYKNDGAWTLNIYPPNAASTISVGAVGIPIGCNPGRSVRLMVVSCTGTTTAPVYGWELIGEAVISSKLIPIAAAATLTATQSGATFTVSAASAYIITIPDPASMSGVSYKFVLTTAGANVVQIKNTGSGTTILGHAVSGPIAAATINVGAGTNTVRFSTSAVVGDVINIVGDGTSWLVDAVSASNVAATGIIFA